MKKKNRKLLKTKNILPILGVISLSILAFIFIDLVQAEDLTWTQTDWRGGTSMAVVSSSVDTFSESTNLNFSEEGILKLENAQNWKSELADWGYRRKIFLNNDSETLSATPEILTDFPVSIKLSDGVNIDYSKTNNDGSDIRLVDQDGALLSYEIETWDETSNSTVWVKVPQIDIGNEDYIWIYYGNTSASDSQNVSDVWSNGFSAVWHLSESGSGAIGEYKDSTSNEYAGRGGNGDPSRTPTQTFQTILILNMMNIHNCIKTTFKTTSQISINERSLSNRLSN